MWGHPVAATAQLPSAPSAWLLSKPAARLPSTLAVRVLSVPAVRLLSVATARSARYPRILAFATKEQSCCTCESPQIRWLELQEAGVPRCQSRTARSPTALVTFADTMGVDIRQHGGGLPIPLSIATDPRHQHPHRIERDGSPDTIVSAGVSACPWSPWGAPALHCARTRASPTLARSLRL